MDEKEFEQLPNVTPAESLSVLVSEKPLALSFFGTDKGREMLRRAYFSCAHTNAELAEIFNTTPHDIQTFVSKQGWPAEREKSRKEGEIAAKRQALALEVQETQLDILRVAQKGINTLKGEDVDGMFVLGSAKAFRSLAQTVNELAPQEDHKSKVNNSIINIGSQVVITDE